MRGLVDVSPFAGDEMPNIADHLARWLASSLRPRPMTQISFRPHRRRRKGR